ncbi:Proteasomal ubiquitin receptor ADRM1 homolog [Eumeta japonica]|uniref:Proteasomal ubiquitin receptor ADRM1 homolog n=1 Tax=Eumeta variegata TaxID=151549 RepID=A0A4C1VLR8_EUMVA|nr:Proteasomal ubiquitin receptor ADRM1 homolog [Eumeta japonica]
MTSGALFGNSSSLGGSSGGNKHLVEFRAGRMTLKGRTVHPDKRKGLLYVYQGEDSLMHFCWKDRTTGDVEDDLLIFPDDCEFLRVNECTTGRVYVLKFKSSSKKYFFWLQEPKTDKDDEYCRRINEVLNNPPTSSGRGSGGGAQDGELQNILNNMSQHQLMQLFGGVGQIGGLSSLLGTMGNSNNSSSGGSTGSSVRPSSGSGANSRGGSAPRGDASRTPSRARELPAPTATPPNTATTTQPPRSGQIILADLQRYFSGLGNAPPDSEGGTGETGGTGGSGANAASGTPRVDLAAALATPESVEAASAPAAAARLAPHLPAAPPNDTSDDVRTTLLSPQFAQAASMFTTALSSGQLAPVISQFGLGPEAVAAANTGDMQAFFKAIENTTGASEGDKSNDGKDDKDKDGKPKDKDNSKQDKDGDSTMCID